MLNLLRRATSQGVIWPPIDFELVGPATRGYLRGSVLNIGAGERELSHLVDGALTNQDICWGPDDQRAYIHIFGPAHAIDRPDATFDTILAIAVLEHVANPAEVVAECFRLLRSGGVMIASVPFLQPEHKVPTDYQRYTRDGLARLFEIAGFETVELGPIFTVYHTLHWIVWEWLQAVGGLPGLLGRVVLLPPLVFMAKRSRLTSDKLASAFQIVARKP